MPTAKGPRDAPLLAMYRPGSRPSAGAIVSDELDVVSDWHYHDMHQLIYAFEAAIEVEVELGRHFVPRQLAAWIPAGVAHRVSIHRVRSGSVFFPGELVPAAGDRIRTVIAPPLMREMMREARRWPLPAPPSRLRSQFFDAMAGLCAEWIEHEADLFLPAIPDPRLQRALQHTAENVEAKLGDICRLAGMSERTLRRHFKRHAGMSWEAYRHRVRVLKAVSLLSESDMPIARIALECGFETPSAFAKAFRQTMREPPSAYRIRAGKA